LRDIQMRDPFMLRQGDTYYLYGSTDQDIWHAEGVGFDVYVARGALTAQTVFDGPYPAFRPPAGFWSKRNFWAPEVYAYAGAYYMFATFLPTSGYRGTAVLRADTPLGPFAPHSDGPVTPRDWQCLDGTLYVTDSNTPWMVFCHEWAQVGDGQICALPLQPDLSAPAGPPRLLFTASAAPWAAPLQGRAPGSYVTDGPYLYRAGDGPLFLLWSSFGSHGNYCIGMAVSPIGDLLGPWRQSDAPIYEADGGHGMLFDTPDGRLYLAIHTPNDTPNERPVFVEMGQGLVPTGRVLA
jgi:hypothetical protein